MKKTYTHSSFLTRSADFQKQKLLFTFIIMFVLNLAYSQQTYTFTNCNATGTVGPTQTQVNTSYSLTNLNGLVTTTTNGIQTWTVPYTGNYRIEARGAQGGGNGGLGASMAGDFSLIGGEVIRILVGHAGDSGGSGPGGGGGGSYVVRAPYNTTLSVLVIAGGGSGAGTYSFNPGVTTTSAGTGGVAGGTNGSGGLGGTRGAGGGGFLTDGGPCSVSTAYANPGQAFVNGGLGGATTGNCSFTASGGFGGGSSHGGNCINNGGAGGGYSGGGGSSNTVSGGGGSFNAGTNQLNATGTNTSHGRVIITELCNITLTVTGANSNNAICSGNSVTLTTNAINNYSWSTGATTSSIVVSPSSTTTYTLGAVSPLNCVAAQAITIIVNGSVPTLTIANSSSLNSNGVCPSRTVALTASGAITYTWSGGASTVINGVAFAPPSAANYTVTGENGCGTSTAVTSVSVHPLPSITPVASTPSLCSGISLTLTGVGTATSYAWSGAPFAITNGVGFNPSSTATYTVIGTSALSCTASATIPVTVVTTPNLAPTSNPGLICIGNSSTLTATGATNYTWTSGTQTVNTATFVVTPGVGVSTYTLVKANANCVDTKTINVMTNSLSPVIAFANPVLVCALKPSTLAVGGGQTYTWTSPAPFSFTFTGASPVINPPVSGIYSVAAFDGTCVNTTTVGITVDPNPTIITVPVSSICAGQSVFLSANGGINYTWTATSGTFYTQSITETPTTSISYNVAGDNSFGCVSSANAIVLVYGNPTITVAMSKTLVCSGGPSTFSASGANSYTWDPTAGGALTATTIVNPMSTISGPVIYTVEGKFNSTGCQSTKTVQVVVFIPTLSVAGNTNTCDGGLINLTASGGNPNSYIWNTGSGNPYTFPTISTTLNAAAVFTVSALTTSLGAVNCPSSKTVSLGIYYNPTITAVPERTFFCRNEVLNLTGNGGVSYVWSNNVSAPTITVSPSTNTNYTVTGTDINGCSSTGTIQVKVSGCTGIDELSGKNSGIVIYPNPNNGEFTISTASDITLTLVNELGQLIRVMELSGANNHQVNFSGLANGIYFVSGQKDNLQVYQKVVVTK